MRERGDRAQSERREVLFWVVVIALVRYECMLQRARKQRQRWWWRAWDWCFAKASRKPGQFRVLRRVREELWTSCLQSGLAVVQVKDGPNLLWRQTVELMLPGIGETPLFQATDPYDPGVESMLAVLCALENEGRRVQPAGSGDSATWIRGKGRQLALLLGLVVMPDRCNVPDTDPTECAAEVVRRRLQRALESELDPDRLEQWVEAFMNDHRFSPAEVDAWALPVIVPIMLAGLLRLSLVMGSTGDPDEFVVECGEADRLATTLMAAAGQIFHAHCERWKKAVAVGGAKIRMPRPKQRPAWFVDDADARLGEYHAALVSGRRKLLRLKRMLRSAAENPTTKALLALVGRAEELYRPLIRRVELWQREETAAQAQAVVVAAAVRAGKVTRLGERRTRQSGRRGSEAQAEG